MLKKISKLLKLKNLKYFNSLKKRNNRTATWNFSSGIVFLKKKPGKENLSGTRVFFPLRLKISERCRPQALHQRAPNDKIASRSQQPLCDNERKFFAAVRCYHVCPNTSADISRAEQRGVWTLMIEICALKRSFESNTGKFTFYRRTSPAALCNLFIQAWKRLSAIWAVIWQVRRWGELTRKIVCSGLPEGFFRQIQS